MNRHPLIFVSAGEASGDHYGAELIRSLGAALPEARFTGLGGSAMETAGQQRVIRAEDVAVMGITEILRHIPRILASYRKLVRSIKQQRPDVAVLIDFPDVNFRLAGHLKRMGVPVIWFVSPQLWAWKRRRLRWVQKRVSKMLTIFPFERAFYAARGVEAEFVGHPLAEQSLPSITREEYAQRFGLDTEKEWIALLPGSRGSELAANLPEMMRAAAALELQYAHAGRRFQFLIPLAPTLRERHNEKPFALIHSGSVRTVQDARAALLHSRAAVVASGTATVQAAVLGTPFITVYRVSRLTFAAAKRLVRYPAEIPAQTDTHGNLPIAMVNLIAGRRIVPELLQEQFTAENIATHVTPLLDDGPERAAQIEALAVVRQRLQSPTGQTAIERLRDAVLTALDTPAPPVYPAAPSASND